MSRNLIKSYAAVSVEEEKRVIDSNAAMAKKMEVLREIFGDAVQETSVDELNNGLDPDQVAALLDEEDSGRKADAQAEIAAMMEEARDEINRMKRDAMDEIEAMRSETFEKAKNDGYMNGYQEGAQKAARLEQQLKLKEQELDQKAKQLQVSYERELEGIEPLLVDELIKIFEHVTRIEYASNREAIVTLLEGAVRQMDSNKNLIVHVSPEDYPAVSENKERLLEQTTPGTTMEIIEDMTQRRNGCYIETDGGVFECGLDTQMEQLGKELRILSYAGHRSE